MSYAYKKDTKGERHGSAVERLLAANRAQAARANAAAYAMDKGPIAAPIQHIPPPPAMPRHPMGMFPPGAMPPPPMPVPGFGMEMYAPGLPPMPPQPMMFGMHGPPGATWYH